LSAPFSFRTTLNCFKSNSTCLKWSFPVKMAAR